MRTMTIVFLFLCIYHTGSGQKQYLNIGYIFLNKCAGCHRTGGEAPFALEEYTDIKRRTKLIREVVESAYMPPWKADGHFRAFANDRSLTNDEKTAIISWIDKGAPEKEFKSHGELSPNAGAGIAYNRKPDLTLKIRNSYTVKGDNTERFIVFKVPFDIDAEKNVEAIEFVANNRKIVHHINYAFCSMADPAVNIYGGSDFIDTDSSLNGDAEYNIYKKNIVYYSGWIPGTSIEYYPKNFGWRFPKRGVVILTVHYSGTPVDEVSEVGVNLYFKSDTIERNIKVINFGSGGIGEQEIMPGLFLLPNTVSTHVLRLMTPQAVSIMYVWPHMHYLGKEFTAFAVTPAGDTINLVHIPKWDFRWQELYRMKHLVKLPKGTILYMTGTYDNTADNPQNPNHPPKIVVSDGNMTSKNEMFTLLILYLPYQEGDENISLE